MGTDDKLHLLLADTGGEATLAAGLDRTAAQRPALGEQRPAPAELWSAWSDPNDLMRQRWGVIAPEGPVGDRLLDLVAPLIEHRRQQQGGDPVATFRVPAHAHMSLAEAAQWKRAHFNPASDLENDLPLYQLVLGDLDQLPLAIQQAQSTDGLVGRIAFDDDDGYRAYADKVVAAETAPTTADAADAVLHTVRDRTLATHQGRAALMAPGHQVLSRWHERGKLRAAHIASTGEATPSADELWTVAARDRPSVLFTLSHGVGAPPDGWVDAAEQRRLQGALSLGAQGHITAADVGQRHFARGGVWLMFACFGAGTPAKSSYEPWLAQLADTGQVDPGQLEHVMQSLALERRPFIAALPKAALANANGPLAFIGHVDLAWSYAFADLDTGRPVNRPGRFMSAVQSMLEGARVGAGFRALSRYLNEVNTELTALYDGADSDVDRVRRAHLWMLRQDLAAYVLLGDPATRLPLHTAAATARPTATVSTDRIAALEVAIGKVLSEQQPIDDVAYEHDIDERELGHIVEAYRQAGRAAISANTSPAATTPPAKP